LYSRDVCKCNGLSVNKTNNKLSFHYGIFLLQNEIVMTENQFYWVNKFHLC